MAFRRDVLYLDECVPEYVNLNAEECRRVAQLIASVLPDLVAAPAAVEWEGTAKDLYVSRLRVAESIAHDLREAFAVAGPALDVYGRALAVSKERVKEGDETALALAELMEPITWYQTSVFQDNEPLARWEDLSRTTGVLDAIAESQLQGQIDRIRLTADQYYRRAAHLYDEARAIEHDARADCLALMLTARRMLPDFTVDQAMAWLMITAAPGIGAEMVEAEQLDRYVRLPGQGVVPPLSLVPAELSDSHQDIRNRAGTIGIAGDSWHTNDSLSWIGNPADEHAFKLRWIANYGPVIEAAAIEYGIPAAVLAGVVYKEIGGKPMWMDDAVDWLRHHGLYPGEPDDTSYGPLAVQVDTAATALGYDPGHLTDNQREAIVASLKDPKQNIMISAKVLAGAKDSTEFAETEPADMTPEQGRRLAAMYNGGADWDGVDAQSYADDYDRHVNEAAEALQ